ncbi:hypothetical protein TVAG_176930 [Trichomonas vaginalis G3]|uniref:PQ loop repeat family protein n=1 Tax=Trichomonas vaginalis (strain ATCC PRA-98 / G3) TaxID=412133 RepID=A2F9S5_TRIV3|nr:SEVEN transmembrane protein 1-related family [Trichomonas vaginalis G3]EAX98323.1 hypothetical protein TVAG_176930 [Trichomonas vaginalis G3]KAI5494551.1 SEVEN transmembrane protein 1-related family [Trichomonas vaginalis G3]|eukprot:XP_001311253.1 hypothetical protein [Trichomonas vaginalis G3]
MDTFLGYDYSWAGFIDYSKCYKEVNVIWLAVGLCVFVGTIISVIPQLYNYVKLRSNYGVNPIAVFMINFSQWVQTMNYFCLHAADFTGLTTASFQVWLPRLVSFLNIFSLWYIYLGNTFLNLIFFDKEPHPNRRIESIRVARITNVFFMVLLHVLSFLAILIFYCIGAPKGFASKPQFYYGSILGTMGGVITVIQYIPQIITTCKVQGPGSLSLILLCIQAPGGLTSAAFLIFGTRENWTTWFPTLMGALQQCVLIVIILFFMCKNCGKNKGNEEDFANKDDLDGKDENSSSDPQPVRDL